MESEGMPGEGTVQRVRKSSIDRLSNKKNMTAIDLEDFLPFG
jgi:hypothetical protein